MYKSITNLNELLEESKQKPVLIFKHSVSCSVSFSAKNEVDSYLDQNGVTDVYLVIVQQQRQQSNEIAQVLGVRHQSPQLIVVQDGEAKEDFSHFSVTQQKIEEVLAAA